MMTFNNQATLSYNGLTITSNTTTGQILDVLSISKSPLVNTYTSRQNLTYVISLVNTGTTAFSDLTITDDLGSYTLNTLTLVPLTYVANSVQYYINGVLQTQPTPTSASPLTVSGISVPAGGNVMIVYEAEINSFAPLDVGDTVTNTVAVSGDGLSSELNASSTVTSAVDPTLTITKTLSPTAVPENGQITYTFIIENTGNTEADASTDIVISDTFAPILNSLTATLNGSTLVLGTGYTYDTTTGAFATTAGAVTVPAATYTQDPATGEWSIVPGSTVLVVSGTV